MDVSCKKSLCMTSYGGIIRIRYKGRSSITSSQPANTSSPVYFRFVLYICFSENSIVFLKKTQKVWFYSESTASTVFIFLARGCVAFSRLNITVPEFFQDSHTAICL